MATTTPTTHTISAEGVGVWDLVSGVKTWRLWAFMGLHDIRQRYRRSSFGPLWLALGLGATILGIGLLYAQILKVAPGNFIPFISISLLIWNMMSTVITESTSLFQSGAGLMTSMRLPYTSFALRCITRNLIVAAHCVAPVVIAFVYYKYPVTLMVFAALPGAVLLIANLYWISLAIGIMCLRYRDIGQMVIYATQLAMFLTPIIWQPSQVRPASLAIQVNPLYHLIELVRGPVFEGRFPLSSYEFCGFMLLVGGALTLFAFVRLRRVLVYWI